MRCLSKNSFMEDKAKLIFNISLSRQNVDDEIIWSLDKNETFKV